VAAGERNIRTLARAVWWRGIVLYLAFVGIANLAWEIAQLPLYTIGQEGSLGEQAFAVLHCTGGDVLIAAITLLAAIAFAGRREWPRSSAAFWRVAGLTVGLGVAFTIFSEWLNVAILANWAYSDLMPVVPPFDTGASPLLQWIAIPAAGFLLLARMRARLAHVAAETAWKTRP
jgi:hypothetical protein